MEAQETKAIKREVKKARIYEFRRLARRIQQLQHKKGTPAQIEKNKRKAERIHNQMEYLKNATADELVEMILKITVKCVGSEKLDDTAAMENALVQRLINTKPMQAILTGGFDNTNSNTDKKPKLKSKPIEAKQKVNQAINYDKKRNKSANSITPIKEEVGQTQSVGKVVTQSCGKASDSIPNDFSFDSDISISGDEIGGIGHGQHKDLGSMFVGSMAMMAEGDVKRTKSKGKRVEKKNKDMKTNRMGQRARRKQWMKQYGRDAKHLKPEQGKSKGSQRMGKQNKLANQDHKRPSTNKDSQPPSQKGALHPSWEASKKKKLRETGLVPFEGKKIRFDDN